MNSGITTYGQGDIVGWTNPSGTTPTTAVQIKLLDVPSADTFWFSVVMPPGRYKVNTLDAGIYDIQEGGSNFYLVGTSVPATFGAAITVSVNQEYNYGALACGKYTIVVGQGTEAQRTWHPNMQISRSFNGAPTASALAIAFQEY